MKKIWKIYGEETLRKQTLSNTSFKTAGVIYDNPDIILNQYANQVYEDTDKLFNGLVTESMGGNSNEATYALYIAASKLKDYMYRLIEVNIQNIIQPYPLEVTLFAKDPKNQRTFTCENSLEFRRKLEELIESPITRAILKHLKTLIEIKEQNEIKDYTFILTDKEPIKRFFFKAQSSPITIRKIILTSHLGKQPDEWAAVIANSFIKIVSTNRKKGNSIEKTISLLQFLSVYQVQPVLELKLVLPDYDFYSHNNSSDSDLVFTLNFKDNNIQFDFFYEADRELVNK